MKLRVDVQYYVETTREPSEDDSWDRGDTAQTVTGVIARLDEKGFDYGFEPQRFKEVFVVLARYNTGDTFGADDGVHCIMDVFDNAEKAYALAAHLERFNPALIRDRVVECQTEFEGKQYYIPWVGYFESFQSVYVWETRIKG